MICALIVTIECHDYFEQKLTKFTFSIIQLSNHFELVIIINKIKNMRLIALHLYKWKPEDAKLYCSDMSLNDLWFYQRGIAKDLINFNSRTIAGRIPKGSKASITLENDVGKCHCWVTQDGIAATALTDNEYDERAAYTLLNKMLMEFRETF